MELIQKKYFLLAMAAILVVALGYMAITSSNNLFNKGPVSTTTQVVSPTSMPDDLNSIESDLNSTSVNDVDRELPSIDSQLNLSN